MYEADYDDDSEEEEEEEYAPPELLPAQKEALNQIEELLGEHFYASEAAHEKRPI